MNKFKMPLTILLLATLLLCSACHLKTQLVAIRKDTNPMAPCLNNPEFQDMLKDPNFPGNFISELGTRLSLCKTNQEKIKADVDASKLGPKSKVTQGIFLEETRKKIHLAEYELDFAQSMSPDDLSEDDPARHICYAWKYCNFVELTHTRVNENLERHKRKMEAKNQPAKPAK